MVNGPKPFGVSALNKWFTLYDDKVLAHRLNSFEKFWRWRSSKKVYKIGNKNITLEIFMSLTSKIAQFNVL